jgi:hypothetical protein
MTGHVWLSDTWRDSALILPLTADLVQSDVDAAIDGQRLNKKGQPVPPELCPARIWGEQRAPTFVTLPDLFFANGYWIVSERAANVLWEFDLGGGALYPIRDGIYQRDNERRIPDEFFCWIYGNTKKAFLEQFSPTTEAMSGATTRDWCVLPWHLKDNDIAVSRAALEGPDVWLDLQLFKSVFVSGRLGDALTKAGLQKAFRLLRCRVL